MEINKIGSCRNFPILIVIPASEGEWRDDAVDFGVTHWLTHQIHYNKIQCLGDEAKFLEL